jgi:hypothetical protein
MMVDAVRRSNSDLLSFSMILMYNNIHEKYMKRIIRHSVFETNSSSTHSLTISKVKDFVTPDKTVVVKMRNMDYLFRMDPSYFCLPEYDELKTMTTREVIDFVLDRQKKYGYSDCSKLNIIDDIVNFLDAVGIDKGFKFDTYCWYHDKFEKEGKAALEYLKTADYPQFDPSAYAPENDFKKKLEFLYCMAFAKEGTKDKRVAYKDISEFFVMVVDRAGVPIKIEVPDIDNCEVGVMEYPDEDQYEDKWNNPEWKEKWNKYREWEEEFKKNLTKTVFPVAEYSKKHYDRTVLEMDVCGFEYPMYMEIHDDCRIGELRRMFKSEKKELLDWLFDNNSGFYRFRNG